MHDALVVAILHPATAQCEICVSIRERPFGGDLLDRSLEGTSRHNRMHATATCVAGGRREEFGRMQHG